jgi:hypothetical protein
MEQSLVEPNAQARWALVNGKGAGEEHEEGNGSNAEDGKEETLHFIMRA